MTAPDFEPVPAGVPPGAVAVSIEPLDPSTDGVTAGLLADCTREGTLEAGQALVRALRSDPDAELYGLTFGGQVLFAYALRRAPMSMELTHIVVAPPLRRQGLGRAIIADAIRRAGARPLVVEVEDATLPFFRACGFKLFGKRTSPAGATRYRLGAHAPRSRPAGAAKEGV